MASGVMAERRRAERLGELLAYAVIFLLLFFVGAWQYSGNRAATRTTRLGAGGGLTQHQQYAELLPAVSGR
jgi:hypothetical protein